MKFKAFLIIALLFSAQSSVTAAEWDWAITPYLWAAGINGDVSAGPIDADISVGFKDIVNALQGGALLRVEAESDQHGVFTDIVFLSLEVDDAKDTLGGTVELDFDSLIVETGYRRKLSEYLALDIGIRYWKFDTKLTPAVLATVRQSTDWTDGFIGARFSNALSDKWNWVLRANVGTGGSDLALGVDLEFSREFARGNRFNAGFRILDVDYSDSSGAVPLDLDMSFSGLTFGYTFNL